MRKTIVGVAAALLTVGLFAGSALALTTAQEARKAACEAIDPGPNVVATYTAGAGAAGANDTCVVVSTATTIEETVEQGNNSRAAKAVTRVKQTETTVTTTQEYRWNTAAVPAGGQKWVAFGDPVTEAEIEVLEECMRTPGIDKCA
jgi:hypothetical protein